jgi:FkbM family methyltransferase
MKPFEVDTNLLKRLKQIGLQLNHIVDVGCHQGKWTEKVKLEYPDASYYLVDSSNTHQEKLQSLGNFIHAYVGQHKEKREYYSTGNNKDETGNSLYKENSNVPFDTKTVLTEPLKHILPDIVYDYIKMDVQGAELEIVEGSLDLFKKTKWVQLECPVFHNNAGSPKFEHYINYMANSGFRVFDIDSIFYNYRLMAVDFLFVNKDLPAQLPTEGDKLIYSHHDTSA